MRLASASNSAPKPNCDRPFGRRFIAHSIGVTALCLAGTGSVDLPKFGAWANEPARPDELLNDGFEAEAETTDETGGQTANAAAVLRQATDFALRAELLTQTAASAADWDRVMEQWLEAIALIQSIPPENPSRIIAQRQLRSYLQHLVDTQQRAEQASSSATLPSLGSDLLDAQLAGYLSYVATVGTPDVLIVGSSRALQGIDPQVMQRALAGRGLGDLSVFNFSVNGATAQVVNFLLSELLPKPLPKVIVWGDGSRAFNDGRRDRTWESITSSPGYQALNRGAGVGTVAGNGAIATQVTFRSPLPETAQTLDAFGFSAVSDRFAPQTYYQQFPRVNGRYDGAYSPFVLYGPQTLALSSLSAFSKAQNSQLIFVNLPLSGSYLDDYRLHYEGQFQQFLQNQSAAMGFEVVDLLTQWQGQPGLFADPSHINQEGAAAIATQLAQHPKVLGAIARPYRDTPASTNP